MSSVLLSVVSGWVHLRAESLRPGTRENHRAVQGIANGLRTVFRIRLMTRRSEELLPEEKPDR